MSLTLRVLLIEDSDDDGALFLQELRRSIYDPIWTRVETVNALQVALEQHSWDVILASDGLPDLGILEALDLLHRAGLDLPFLVISEGTGEGAALALMQAGAHDYLPKNQLSRLVPAIARELQAASLRRGQQQTEVLLRQALLEIDKLIQERVHDHQTLRKMKDEFISIISHELRTPLASLQGAIDLLLHNQLGQLSLRGQRMLEIAANNTERLVQLINTIFDLQQFASPGATLSHRVYDIYSLIEQAVATLAPAATQAGVQLSVTAFSVPLWGDGDRILQVLLHLLSNAIKFSEPGSTIWLSLELIDQNSSNSGGRPCLQAAEQLSTSYILIRVRDQGQGIPANKLAAIFEEFQQADASDSRRRGGAGLGLALCRTIACQHQGSLWVESQPGQGSTFYLVLPTRQGQISNTEIRDFVESPCDSQTSTSY